jgi:hypothetical protein
MRNTQKRNNELNMEYIMSRKFIVDFLETIEQPLNENEIKKILEGSKYLNEYLELQKEKYGVWSKKASHFF